MNPLLVIAAIGLGLHFASEARKYRPSRTASKGPGKIIFLVMAWSEPLGQWVVGDIADTLPRARGFAAELQRLGLKTDIQQVAGDVDAWAVYAIDPGKTVPRPMLAVIHESTDAAFRAKQNLEGAGFTKVTVIPVVFNRGYLTGTVE